MKTTRKKLMAFALSFVMAFTVFGMMGTASVNAEDGDAAVTVFMWYGKVGADMPTTKDKALDKSGLLAEVTTPITQAQLDAMDQTGKVPYFFSGKGKLTVIAASGVAVGDLLARAGIDPGNLSGLKTAQIATASPDKGPFLPNNDQLKYLSGGVTYTGATSDTITDATATSEVPFIIATKRYEGSNLVSEQKNAGQVADQIWEDNAYKQDGLRACPGSIKDGGDWDIAGNKFVGGVDSICAFKTADASDVDVNLEYKSTAYDGKAKTPAAKVTLGETVLEEGTDYSVAYKNNTNAGTAEAVITGITFEGTTSESFAIGKASIAKAGVTVGSYAKTYNGKAKTPALTVKLGGKTLVKGTDYTVAYKNNVNAGKATATVTGKGNYSGSLSRTFAIAKATNPMTANAKAKVLKVKHKKLKKKKQTIKAANAFVVAKAQGKVTYAKVKGSKKITVAGNGRITVKKKTKKGTYKISVRVSAAGNNNYNTAAKTVTLKIKVK